MQETIFHFEDDGLISSILQILPIPYGDLELSDIFFFAKVWNLIGVIGFKFLAKLNKVSLT